MTIAGGTSVLKFINYGIFAVIILGVLAGIVNGVINYRQTGDSTMLIENTLGEVVTWDTKIHVSMVQLLDTEFINSIPEEIRSDYVSSIAKGVFLNIFLLALLIYVLFRLGNWIVGLSQFSPTTDIIIIVISVGIVFAVVPLLYGYFMDKQVTIFSGIVSFIRNFDVWWAALSGSVTQTNIAAAGHAAVNNSVISVVGGS